MSARIIFSLWNQITRRISLLFLRARNKIRFIRRAPDPSTRQNGPQDKSLQCKFFILLQALRLRTFGYASHIRQGIIGEALAVHHLSAHGYYIWKRNWRCHYGEIDIIAYKNRILVFIEVKTRTTEISEAFSPWSAVDQNKQATICTVARRFRRDFRAELKLRRLRSSRFDIVAVYLPKKGNANVLIDHCENAFGERSDLLNYASNAK